MRMNVDRKKFDAVKIMLNGGATYEEVSDYLSISTSTVQRIKKAESYDEYKNMNAAIALAKRNERKNEEKKEDPKPQEPATPPLSTVFYQSNRMWELLKEQNEHLKAISNKLAFIVDELTK